MLAHMRKNHQDATKIRSPLGSFPSSNSATVLQFDEDEAATQENSSGAVNSPKIVMAATYVCAVCEIHFQNKKGCDGTYGQSACNCKSAAAR